ncbi:MAG: DUF3006 family protein [Selenomonadaceae bacterium]|nr:DUF3006 family protein [Selenomonadaceae bacterium]
MDRTSDIASKGTKEISVFLDRIEELEDESATAVLYVEDEEDEFREFVLPADFLPEDVGEGEYLTITISRAEDKTREALDEARNLLKSMTGNEE